MGSETKITHKALELAIYQIAKPMGWMCCIVRAARVRCPSCRGRGCVACAQSGDSWRTPLRGDKGLPDVILAHTRQPWLLFVELKCGKDTLKPEQCQWRDALVGVSAALSLVWKVIDSVNVLAGVRLPGLVVAWYEWRERDYVNGTIEAVLRNPVQHEGNRREG